MTMPQQRRPCERCPIDRMMESPNFLLHHKRALLLYRPCFLSTLAVTTILLQCIFSGLHELLTYFLNNPPLFKPITWRFRRLSPSYQHVHAIIVGFVLVSSLSD